MSARRSLDRRILALALPAAGSILVQVIHRMVDMAWLRDLGTEAVAALTISTVSVWAFAAIGWFVAMGMTALIARYGGALQVAGARYVGAQGMRWAVAIGVLCAGLGWFLAPLFFTASQADTGVREAGLAYTRVYWGGGAFVLLQFAADAIFRGHGNTRTPFKIAVASLLLNVALDPLLIWGWGPIPALGVPGAALATILATLFAAALLFVALLRAGHLQRDRPTDADLRLDARTRLGRPGLLGLDGSIFVRMARVGTPSMCASLLFNLILLEMLRVAHAAGGSAAQAGLGIGHQGEGIAFVICLGWAGAASALVGRNMGAGKIVTAERAAWRAAWQCSWLCLAWGLVLFVFADGLAAVWAEEAAAAEHAASYFRIVALCLVPQAVGLVIDGAFSGAGMTMPPMITGVLFAGIRVPLAWWAAFDLGLGVNGVWIVVTVTAALRGVAVGWWFARGTWKMRSV